MIQASRIRRFPSREGGGANRWPRRKPPAFGNSLAILAVVLLAVVPVSARVKVLRIEPGQTDPAIAMVHGPDVAVYDPQASSKHRLFFFIGGTGSNPSNSLAMYRTFAKWGYHVVSIDYENNLITVAFAHSLDPTSFGRYRDAIITGAPVSDRIKVNAANSILNRFQKLLVYLAAHDSKGGWSEFVQDGKPAWGRTIVGGHSQGSGHAAYIGKMFCVQRVLIFSGPQDYLDDLHEPAPWLDEKSATPSSRFFAFLSKNDPFNVHHQEMNCAMLMHLAVPTPIFVKPERAIQGDSQILINNVPKRFAHGSTLSTHYTNVWDYMLTHTPLSGE
ncbi:MAG: BPSS1187 family protein [Limisphaerales bacterium]